TRKGGTFVRADFSDASGQFSAACFEEALVPQFERWADSGECLLLTVELDSPSPDEPPRLTVRGARPLAAVSGSTAMQLKADIATHEALLELKIALDMGDDDGEGVGNGEVLVRLTLEGGGHAQLRLGRRFQLSGELAERLAEVPGISNVELAPVKSKASLRLVA
ncbi:MAG: DNA polymerase III subunit alpha, partial [Erythrobacter sp.]